jgi:cytochrome c
MDILTMKKGQRIIEVGFDARRSSSGVRGAMIAGLLLAVSATTAIAADPAAGQQIFKAQCSICHAVVAGRNGVGPTLFGVAGRPAGSVPGFQYTADHKKLGVTWDAATLDKYLTNPRAMVPDTTMIYAGLKDDAERANLIAYLETLH